jgi:hypothetical protein
MTNHENEREPLIMEFFFKSIEPSIIDMAMSTTNIPMEMCRKCVDTMSILRVFYMSNVSLEVISVVSFQHELYLLVSSRSVQPSVLSSLKPIDLRKYSSDALQRNVEL